MTFTLEIACFNPESALVASRAGADRIELCQSPEVGGTTPDFNALILIRDRVTIPIFIMIRPRGEDFVYSDAEFQQMKDSIQQYKALADGFVFGLLNVNKKVDVDRTSELVHLASPKPCTFHRAFDETSNLLEALEATIRCGISTVLTSGGQSTAIHGSGILAQLVENAQGRIEIMPGGGVRSTNLEDLRRRTKAKFFHSSALTGDGIVASFAEIQRLQNLLKQAWT